MSDNLINNSDLSSDSIEPFDSKLSGYYGNLDSTVVSVSALNKDDKNLHNSVYSRLVPGVKGTINKHFKKFNNMEKHKINPYFYNEKPGDAAKCNAENLKLKQSAAYQYQLSTGECSLYNKNPNEFEDDPDYVCGYKINQKFDASNIEADQRKNVLRRMGSQYLQKTFNIKNTDINKDVNKCIKPEFGDILLKVKIIFYTGCERWDGSSKFRYFFLTYRGKRVSNIVYSSGLDYPKCGWRWWTINFQIKSTKIDGIKVFVGNDGIRIRKLDFSLGFGKFNQHLFTMDARNIENFQNNMDSNNFLMNSGNSLNENFEDYDDSEDSDVNEDFEDSDVIEDFKRRKKFKIKFKKKSKIINLFSKNKKKKSNKQNSSPTEDFTDKSWIKNTSRLLRFPREIDLNAISFSQLPQVTFKGTSQNKTITASRADTTAFDKIMEKDNWSIKTELIVDKYVRGWRNIFHAGNTNGERAPAMWIFWNDSWRMHFRIRTNRNWNDGFNFYIPRKLRKYGRLLTINIDYIKYTNEKNNSDSGFIMNFTVNGIYVGTGNFTRRKFQALPNRKFYIKDPWYRKDHYNVKQVIFSTVPLIKITTGYERGYYETKWRFNNMISKLQPPYYLIRVGYQGYNKQHNYIVYKRKTSSNNVDMYSLLHTDWFNERKGVKNKFHVDYDLYSTIDDAINNKGAWKFCNFNDPGIGFPRDCGINRPVGNQWQSKDRGNKKTWAWYLYKAEQDFVDVGMVDIMKQKLKSYNAEADCVYRNLSDPKKNYSQNKNALNADSIGNIYPLNNEDSLLNADLQRYKENVQKTEDVANDVLDTNDNTRTSRQYDADIRNLSNKYKENDDTEQTLDFKSLEQAVEGDIKDNIENFQNNNQEIVYQNIDQEMESYENSSCSKTNKFYLVLIFIILLLIIIYFLYNN